jgi:hypothetical protein
MPAIPSAGPDERGRYGSYGGRFVPETLVGPLQELEEAYKRIYPTVSELNTIITPDHLIDDFTLSRNIAKYGLKFITFRDVLAKLGYPNPGFLWHLYTIPIPLSPPLKRANWENPF